MSVTISYLYPTNLGPLAGGNVAPTQLQMGSAISGAKFNTVVATVVATAAADTSAVITHNFQLTNAEISQGWPRVILVSQGDETTAAWYEASENPNYTVLVKNTLGVGATIKAQISRPITADR